MTATVKAGPSRSSASSTSSSILRLPTARAFAPLLRPARYKGAYGGRGSGKSHFFAEAWLGRSLAGPTRAVCIREVQNSLKESVRQLLIDKMEKHGVRDRFEVLDAEIRGANGSLCIFRGMQTYNAETIKSLEGYDIAWVEEAQNLSARSLRLLRPTIRKDGSEIWLSWNPRFDVDAVDAFLRGGKRPSDAIVVEANWYDNPWFPDVLRREKDDDYRTDPEMAEHVWGGGYEVITEGSYYAKLLAETQRSGRIGHFPYNPLLPVLTAWDIGVDDYTAGWFFQEDGQHVFVIDYYETGGEGAEQVVQACMPELLPDPIEMHAGLAEIGREVPFRYGRHFWPHDVRNREWGAGGRSRIETLMGLGVKPIHVGAAMDPAERVNAVRRVLPVVHFHDCPRVQLGLSRLRRYRRKFNEALGTYVGPLHDVNSHGADAFGEIAVNCSVVPAPPPKKPDASKRSGFSRARRASPSQNWRMV